MPQEENNERMQGLLRALQDGALTIDNVLLKCSEWTAETIDAYQFKPLPIKPREVLSYEEIDPMERKMLGESYYGAQPAVRNYYNLVRQIMVENNALYKWLKECRELLEKAGQAEAVAQIEAKLSECKQEMLIQITEEGGENA